MKILNKLILLCLFLLLIPLVNALTTTTTTSTSTTTTIFTVGVDYWSGNTKSTFTNSDLPLLKDAGIQMLRIEFNDTNNSKSMNNLRTLVPAVVNNNIKVLGLLIRKDLAPDNVDAWGDWVYNTVNEFKNNVHVWECWNEPNLENFFSGKDPVKYTAFLKKCYEQAKRADPTCKVLGGSVVFTHQTALNFLTAIYQNGAKDYMDRLSYHPYCTPYAPDYTGSDSHNPYIWLGTKVRPLMVSFGDTRPLWITEVGWTTADVGETKQSDYLVKALQMARDWGWVETFIIYNWKDSSTSGSLTKGLLRTDRTLKPSYYAVKDFISSPTTTTTRTTTTIRPQPGGRGGGRMPLMMETSEGLNNPIVILVALIAIVVIIYGAFKCKFFAKKK